MIRPREPKRAVNLRAIPRREVLEEFAERASIADEFLYAPPWSEKLIGGRLGPEYGPNGKGQYEKMLSEYAQSKPAGGLWDRETEMESNPKAAARETSRVVQRYDAEKMQRFVERHSHEIPERELEVYFLFYRDLKSKGSIARELRTRDGRPLSKRTVEVHLTNLRRRCNGR